MRSAQYIPAIAALASLGAAGVVPRNGSSDVAVIPDAPAAAPTCAPASTVTVTVTVTAPPAEPTTSEEMSTSTTAPVETSASTTTADMTTSEMTSTTTTSSTPTPTSSSEFVGPDWANAKAVSISFSGNGCPQGSASILPAFMADSAANTSSLRVSLADFVTSIGPGTSVSDRTKNCQLHLNLKYAPGAAVTVLSVTNHGYAKLDAGVTATLFNTYYFSQNAAATYTDRVTVQGGGDLSDGQTFTRTDVFPSSERIWSPCGSTGILNLNSRVALTSSNSTLTGTVDMRTEKTGGYTEVTLGWKMAC